MRKIILLFCSLLFVGCSSKAGENETIDFDEPLDIEENYSFGHGVVDYQFEKWNFSGEPLTFDYEIKNIDDELEFGLVFLVDGLPQTYEVDGETTSMFKTHLKTGEETTISISMTPKVHTKLNETNLNAYVVLNPSTEFEDIKKYKTNHGISSTPTISLNLEDHKENTDFNEKTLKTDFEPISNDVLTNLLGGDGTMLRENIFLVSVNDDTYIKSATNLILNAYGKSGHYRLLTVEDNVITDASEIEIKEETYTKISLNLEMEDVTNLYFLLVPLDVQDVHGYLMMSQSNRWIVE